MEEKEEQRAQKRILAVAALLGVLILVFSWVLYQNQIVKGNDYWEASQRKVAQKETVQAARGIITDSRGQVLVGNRQSQQVTLDRSVMGDQASQNAILLRLIEICREEGITWTDELPITAEPPFQFTRTQTLTDPDTGQERVLYDPFYVVSYNEYGREIHTNTNLGNLIATLAKSAKSQLKWKDDEGNECNIQDYVDVFDSAAGTQEAAQAFLDWFCYRYEIGPEVSDTDKRALVGIYYELALLSNEVIYEYTFAGDVDIDFISRVKEENLNGVMIDTATVREYKTDYAAHLLGTTGVIHAEDWPEYRELGYNMNDIVGIDGIERAFEAYLHGTPGVRIIETNTSGKVISEVYETMPGPGNAVETTLISGLQKKVEDALAQYVPQLEGSKGAAMVALDPNDGSMLAAGSYPTYSLKTYRQDYNDLAEDELTPLLNRATMGLYAPGSTFKMASAVAGLEEGVITTRETIRDLGVYTYYDAHPKCWLYRQNGGTHGRVNVSEAIRDSCNYYFYDTIVRLDDMDDREGIDILNSYVRSFGLGEATGIEVSEYTGVVAGPAYNEKLGTTWYRGNMLYAAIGQSDYQFTPVQMANYVATLVNGGNRYQVHLLKSVKSYDFSEVIEEYEPVVLNTVEMADSTVEAVKAGMLMVTTEGSVAKYFNDLRAQGIRVGAKTGSAQVAGQEKSNAMFVCFAPYDDPQIVLAIAVEAGGSGSELGAIAADVLSYYFSADAALEAVEPENTILN